MMQEPDNKSRTGSAPGASPGDAQGEGRSDAWGLNEAPSPALDQGELARVAERNRLIIQVMEINAKQRHFESMHLGIKLELEHTRRAETVSNRSVTTAHLETKFSELTRVLEKLVVERDFLEAALAEIDGAPPPRPAAQHGRA